MLQYMLERGEIKDKTKFYEIINNDISYELGDKVMSLGEQLRQEGMEQSKLTIAEKLILKGYDLYEIADITDLSMDQLITIKNKQFEIIQ